MLGYPETAEQVEKFREEGLDFDRIIFLTDTNEEEVGKIFVDRNIDNTTYDHDKETENANNLKALYGEQFEEKLSEVSCNGSIEEVFTRVLATLDPFFILVDNNENVKTTEDLAEDEYPITIGEYGNYCPVTLTNDSWLFPVVDGPELEV